MVIHWLENSSQALKQVQSLGAQLGLSGAQPEPKPEPKPQMPVSPDVMSAITRLAPVMGSFSEDDDVSRLLGALRPFLSEEKQQKLDRAQRLMKLVRIIPLIKDSGLFL